MPDVIGAENVFVSLVSILSVIVCLRYEYAIVLPDRDEEAAHVAAISLIAALFMSGLSAIAIALVGEPLLQGLHVPELRRYLWCIPPALLIQGLFRTMNYWNTRHRRFERISFAQVTASLTTSSIQVSTGLLRRATIGSLIGSWMAGTTIYTGVLTLQTLKDSWVLLRNGFQRSPMLAALKRFRKFALIDTWGGLINTLSWQLPTLMLSSLFSSTVVGFYGLSNRVITLPLTLIGNAIGQVFFQQAADLRNDSPALIYTIKTVFQILVALSLFPALVLTISGKELFIAVFGNHWTEAGIYAQILGIWMFFLFISSPLAVILSALERQEVTLITQLAILLTRILALIIGGATHDIYKVLVIWAGSGALIYCGLTLWNMKVAQIPPAFVFRTFAHYGMYALPFSGILLGIKIGLHPSAWTLTLVSGGIAAVHYALLFHQEPSLCSRFRNMISSR